MNKVNIIKNIGKMLAMICLAQLAAPVQIHNALGLNITVGEALSSLDAVRQHIESVLAYHPYYSRPISLQDMLRRHEEAAGYIEGKGHRKPDLGINREHRFTTARLLYNGRPIMTNQELMIAIRGTRAKEGQISLWLTISESYSPGLTFVDTLDTDGTALVSASIAKHTARDEGVKFLTALQEAQAAGVNLSSGNLQALAEYMQLKQIVDAYKI